MVQNMRENGMSIKSIARELSISRNSVRKYLYQKVRADGGIHNDL